MTEEVATESTTFYFVVNRAGRRIRVSKEEWEQDWLNWWNRKGSLDRKRLLEQADV